MLETDFSGISLDLPTLQRGKIRMQGIGVPCVGRTDADIKSRIFSLGDKFRPANPGVDIAVHRHENAGASAQKNVGGGNALDQRTVPVILHPDARAARNNAVFAPAI